MTQEPTERDGRSTTSRSHKRRPGKIDQGLRNEYRSIKDWIAYQRDHPIWALCFFIITVSIGYGVNEGLTYIKNVYFTPDDSISNLRKSQEKAFGTLDHEMQKLNSSLSGSGSSIFNRVEDSISGVKSLNTRLINQLAAAKKQNKVQASINKKNGMVAGSYSFTLSSGSGIELAPGVNIGVTNVWPDNIEGRFSDAGSSKDGAITLYVGDERAFKNESGTKCSVGLLSVYPDPNRPGTGAAAFSVSCKKH